jgi:peptidoglycan/LPS O-acetylase OafA/YrhL
MKRGLTLDKFQRITSTGNYIPEIDGLRFVAIITVLLLHLNTNYKRAFSHTIPEWYEGSVLDHIFLNSGWGVELFFAISGYILSVPFIRESLYNGRKVELRAYFIRRLTRLEPPFVISLVVIYFASLLVSSYNFEESIPHFIITLFYSHMFVYGTWSTINPITWSLETEVQFYILAPLLVILFRSKKEVYLGILLVLFLASIYAVGTPFLREFNLYKSIIPSFQWFSIGILIAYLSLRFPNWFRKPLIYADVFAWLGIPLLYICKIYFNQIFFDLGVLIFFISVFKSITFKGIICNRWITTIGGMCYSIYLIHYALIYFLMKCISRLELENFYLHLIIVFVFVLFVVLFCSFIFFRFFERPFMDKNWWKKMKAYS